MSEYKVWVGCLACYNNGDLVGDWFDAGDSPQNEEEFNEAVPAHVKLQAADVNPHEELWVFDHENSPVEGEYSPWSAKQYAEWMGDIHESEAAAFSAYVKHVGTFDEDSAEAFRDSYQGDYSSNEDFAQELADSLGLLNKEASWPNSYIDWERAARDLMMDYFEEDGHYFRA